MLYYETIINQESSEWVIFVHGIAGSTKTWKKQIDDFSKDYNILLLDLAGHGESRNIKTDHNLITMPKDIKEILDYLNIEQAHFVGMSLGTIVLMFYVLTYPETVKSLVFGGAITTLQVKGKIALWLAQKIKYVLPQKLTCSIFAQVVMPKNNHKLSRKIFIRESIKMKKEEFMSWIDTLSVVNYSNIYIEMLKQLKNIPMLYIMGSEDYLFYKGAKDTAKSLNAEFKTIDNCGHVCSIERYKEFNNIAIEFLQNIRNSFLDTPVHNPI